MTPIGNVLIVEDDADTREMLATLLSMEGFHAVAAEDGLEALHLLRTVRHRAPDIPCLVLLDLKMLRRSVPCSRRRFDKRSAATPGSPRGQAQ